MVQIFLLLRTIYTQQFTGYTGLCWAFYKLLHSTDMKLWSQEYKTLWVILMQWQYFNEFS